MNNGKMHNKKYTASKKDVIKFIALILLCIGLIVATILLMPYAVSLKDEAVRESIKEFITSKGILGVLILLGLQMVQVIIAFIPGEFVEILAGLLYGTFFGYLICTIGVLIGSIIIYYSVRALGYSFINKMFGEGKLSKYKFLNNQKQLNLIVFILFFMPGTPKDLLTYFIPFTKMKPMSFFVISAIARIPSIISSTFAGSSIGDGKWMQTVIVFVVIGAIGILGIMFNEKILSHFNKK